MNAIIRFVIGIFIGIILTTTILLAQQAWAFK
jgi:hypothetical protein